MKKIIIFWGEVEEPSFRWQFASKLALSDSAEPVEPLNNYQIESHEIMKADLACMADMAESYDIALVISSKDVVVSKVLVPNKAQRLLRKAVPYMLEEEVATPVDDLFFALADKAKDSHIDVRAIDRSYIEDILETFKAAEIRLAEVIVDVDLLPVVEDGITVVANANQYLVVDSNGLRWHCHPDDFVWLIQKQIENNDDDDDLPVAIPLAIYSEEPLDRLLHQLPVGRFASEAHQVENIEEYLLEQYNNESSIGRINLLQAEYEAKKESSRLSNFLRKVASVAAFVLVTHLVYQGVNIFTLSEKKEQLEQQKYTLYKQAFPGTKKIRRPEKSMKIYINSLGNAGADVGFLSLLSSSSNLLTDLNKIYPTNINYDNTRNELRMDVIASDLDVLDQYADALRAKGHEVEKSSETQRGEGYSSRLTIRR